MLLWLLGHTAVAVHVVAVAPENSLESTLQPPWMWMRIPPRGPSPSQLHQVSHLVDRLLKPHSWVIVPGPSPIVKVN